jgi:aspartate aminotransferase
VAKACTKLQGQFTSGANTIAQMATKAAVLADPSCTHDMKAVFQKRRDLMVSKLKEIPGLGVNTPTGAFYVFPDVSSFLGKSANGKIIETADDLAMYLVEDALVATTSGASFGCPNNIRMSYAAADEVLTQAIERMKKSLAKLG